MRIIKGKLEPWHVLIAVEKIMFVPDLCKAVSIVRENWISDRKMFGRIGNVSE